MPTATAESALAELPTLSASGFAFIGIQGLNVKAQSGKSVVAGQPILQLVAVPTTGRHYVAAQSTTLRKNRVYRVTAWVKGPAGVMVEMQASDELKPRGKLPTNYGSALFDPATRTVLSSSGLLKGRGIDAGADEWRKIWVDLTTAGGEFVLALGLVTKDGMEFKGDGRVALTYGGIEVAERN
jgi:hypothetical protein